MELFGFVRFLLATERAFRFPTERSFRWNFLDLLDFFLLPKGRSDFLPKGRSDGTYKEVFEITESYKKAPTVV